MPPDQEFQDALAEHTPKGSVIANADGSMALMRSFFAAEEGVLMPGRHLKLGVCMSGGGLVRYHPNGRDRNMRWRHGHLFLTAPYDDSEFATPDVDMIGLAVDLSAPAPAGSPLAEWERRKDQPARMIADEVMRSVLVALWSSAEFHAGSSAFIEHGVEIILQRALMPDGTPHVSYPVNALSWRQMETIREYVDANLADDIRIADLSTLVGMTSGRFSKALQATIGFAPYAYLTARRMERAKTLLDAGEPATETALSVGYANPSKFSAAFRRLIGLAPSEWKRQRL